MVQFISKFQLGQLVSYSKYSGSSERLIGRIAQVSFTSTKIKYDIFNEQDVDISRDVEESRICLVGEEPAEKQNEVKPLSPYNEKKIKQEISSILERTEAEIITREGKD